MPFEIYKVKWAVKFTENTDIGEYETRFVVNPDGKRVLFDTRSLAFKSAACFADSQDARLVKVKVYKKKDKAPKSYGRIAFEAYEGMPECDPRVAWDELHDFGDGEQADWEKAAQAVIAAYLKTMDQ